MAKVTVIGAGFAGISASCHLAKMGHDVLLLEKNSEVGGRARKLELDGFHFDMGPSWYWMPDVFERFFESFGKRSSDYYELIRLDPSYGVKFKDEFITIPSSMEQLEELFESIEPGSARQLQKFLKQAEYKYNVGIKRLVHKPNRSIFEFMDPGLLYGLLKMDVFTSMRSHIAKFFKDSRLRQLAEFPVLFLGATPQNTPALYSLMNYADMSLGTWYPKGGMYKVIEGMIKLAQELGVQMQTDTEVRSFSYAANSIATIQTSQNEIASDIVVAGADYHHIDTQVLDPQFQNYADAYWSKRTMAPSSLLFYLGVNKPLPNLLHHTLFFDEDFDRHAHEIYTDPQWPSKPLLYTSATSKTDKTAPEGMENLVVLIPVSPDIEDSEEIREKYYSLTMDRLEAFCGTSIRDAVIVKKSYAHRDFKADYHAFRGNAYGLANTLRQTAILKPGLKNKKLKNLYYTGQLTVPGPGVPPSLISGEVVAKEVHKAHKHL